MTIEIVDLPIKWVDFPVRYVKLPEGSKIFPAINLHGEFWDLSAMFDQRLSKSMKISHDLPLFRPSKTM